VTEFLPSLAHEPWILSPISKKGTGIWTLELDCLHLIPALPPLRRDVKQVIQSFPVSVCAK
jgi:hypothetical protein